MLTIGPIRRTAGCGAVLLFLLTLASSAIAATVLRTQPSCGAGVCQTFTGTGIRTLRSYSLIPPRVGTALVLFHGSGYCENTGSNRGMVHFDGRIVADAAGQVGAGQAGGAKFQFTVDQAGGIAPNGSVAVSLNAMRTVTISSKTARTFLYKVNVYRIDAGITCRFYNLSFTVQFQG